MRLTYQTDYGLRMLLYLAIDPGQVVPVGKVAEAFGISRNHLLKVVRRLRTLGYVDTTRGQSGGVTLAVDPTEITLGDVVRRLEPDFTFVECFEHGRNSCPIDGDCLVKLALEQARAAWFDALERFTLADVTRNRSQLLVKLGFGDATVG